MSTSHQPLESALGAVDSKFRHRIVKTYMGLRTAFASGTWDTVGLRAGTYIETLLRFLQHELTGTFVPFGKKIPNLADECRRLERTPSTSGPESLRVVMPRALVFMYTIRNKRGIGHAGGDIEANAVDADACERLANWCMCELIRIYHQLPLEDAQAILNALAVRHLPNVWSVGVKKRVLDSSLSYKNQVLLLLHGEMDGMALVEDLFEWIEHPRFPDFKRRVLSPLHEERLVEWDEETDSVTISPTGIALVESNVIPRMGG